MAWGDVTLNLSQETNLLDISQNLDDRIEVTRYDLAVVINISHGPVEICWAPHIDDLRKIMAWAEHTNESMFRWTADQPPLTLYPKKDYS